MPVTIRTNTLKYKKEDGTYNGFNAIAQESTDQQLASIQAAGTAAVGEVQDKGDEVLDSIPDDYETLSADVSALKSAITQDEDNVALFTGNYALRMSDPDVQRQYIQIPDVGETVSLTPATAQTYPYRYCIVDCSPNDVFYISAQTHSSVYAYAFADSDNKIIGRYGLGGVYNNRRVVSPANSAKLIINDYSGTKTSYKGPYIIDSVKKAQNDVDFLNGIVRENISYMLELEWTDGKYIISTNGSAGTSASMACTDFTDVSVGQKLFLHVSAYGTNECGVAFYNSSQVYIPDSSRTSEGETIVTVPDNAVYARFSTKKAQISVADAYVESLVDTTDSTNVKNFFISDSGTFIMGETAREFYPKGPKLEYAHKGNITPASRFLAIGFDDFRSSDFSFVLPLFEKYASAATFNRVARTAELTYSDKQKINSVLNGRHEMGDHTFMHYAFPYEDALFNGQDPSSPDGSQTPYPTNAQLREDAGSGKNAFYLSLTGKVSNTVANSPLAATVTWGELTDEQCQTLREYYSVYKNPTLSALLDGLSNKYLGTTGTSAGSWNSTTGKYTGGIFTGCATSANHEVWERILQIVQCYYKDQYGLNWDFQCWSWPGEYYFGRGFSNNGYIKYYDAERTIYYNMNARFASSLYADELGNAKTRSFTDVLRTFGYKYTHDYIYPSRLDYLSPVAMKTQFYLNEHLSKQDGVLYPTNRTVTYSSVAKSYPSTFFTTGKTKGAQMYDANGTFRNFIEALRHDTAHGIVHGEVMDSTDNYSMRVFFEEALRFCQSAGIQVVTKAEAYDACFHSPVESGNLIYNPQFRNTAAEYFVDATNVPTNPDGYSGDCSVTNTSGENILATAGDVTYIHYGIPLGKVKYSAEVKGAGSITVYLIKCGSAEDLSNLTQLATVPISSSDAFATQEIDMVIPDNPMTTWTTKLEGRDNKVMGIKIVYSTGLQIKNIRLEKC